MSDRLDPLSIGPRLRRFVRYGPELVCPSCRAIFQIADPMGAWGMTVEPCPHCGVELFAEWAATFSTRAFSTAAFEGQGMPAEQLDFLRTAYGPNKTNEDGTTD